VQARALEREAKAQRDLLESYLAKYREATTRENIEAAPADGRIISRASVSNSPAYPKKLPIVLLATLATLMLSTGTIVTGELLRMTIPRAAAFGSAPVPMRESAMEVAASPVDPGIVEPKLIEPQHIAPKLAIEPVAVPLAPEIEPEFGEVEQLADRLLGAG